MMPLTVTPEAVEAGKKVFMEKTCFACHGVDAKTPILPVYPRLAGQNQPYLLQQMRDIKSGTRSNGNTAAMRGIMHLVDDEDLQTASVYISQLPP
jgi:cytochrome c